MANHPLPEPEPIPPQVEKCFHRIVYVDYDRGVERCDNKECGHVFRTFAPKKHDCHEPDGICRDKCLEELR